MIKIGDIVVDNHAPFVLIAGPCVIESEEMVLETADYLKELTRSLNIPYIFKASFDKANRSSIHSYRGPGIKKGLKILEKVKKEFKIPVTTDIHESSQAEVVGEVVDIIQIPAFLSRQTDLLVAAAKTQKPVNIKKGQFLSPWDVKHVIEKLKMAGNDDILITERGFSFGYNNLVVDMRSIPIMRNMGIPVVFDATHSLQLPGGKGNASGGLREYIPDLARAAVATGVSALFMEVHPDPDNALCDGPNMLPLSNLSPLLKILKKIDSIVKNSD